MKIRIIYNPYLDEIFTTYCQTLPNFKGWIRPSKETVEQKVEEYKKAWEPIESEVFKAIEEKTKRNHPYSKLDVSIVSACHRSYSTPIVIASYLSVERFLTTLIHELIHKTSYKLNPDFMAKFDTETQTTKNHIFVHALLEYIFIDVLKMPKLLESNKKSSLQHSTSDYSRAWDIVEKKGYNVILKEIQHV